MSGSHSSSRPKTVHGGSIPQQQMSSSSSSVSSSSSHIHPHSAQPSLQSRSSSSGKPQSLKEKAFLEQLKEIQHMEQQTKQTLEMFMSTLNNRTTSEDCASLLLEKIEDLRKAEIEIDNKNVENGILQSKINELVERNENIVSINKKIMEEKGQLQHMLGESDKVIRKLESQFTLQQRNFSLDLEQRNSTIKVLEEEGTCIKAEMGELTTRLETASLETSELHGVLAQLHGQLSSLQSELDDAREREGEVARQRREMLQRLEAKEEILLKGHSEKMSLQNRILDLERRLSDMSDKTTMIAAESNYKVDTLVKERESSHGSLAKMSLKIKQQSQTLIEMNSFLGKLKSDLAVAIEGRELAEGRLFSTEKVLSELRIAYNGLEAQHVDTEKTLSRTALELKGLGADVLQVKDRNNVLTSENRKLSTRADRLEKDKYDMALDLAARGKETEALKNSLEQLGITIEELKDKLEVERSAKEKLVETNGTLDMDLDRYRSDCREHQENVDSLSRQLREADRMREQALEVSRTQQRENANRIVEFSQKNAKLQSEFSSLKDELSTYKRSKDDNVSEIQDLARERDDLRGLLNANKVRLAAIEEQFLDASSRLEQRRAEMDDLRAEYRKELSTKDAIIANLNTEHERALSSLARRVEEKEDESSSAMSKLKALSDSNLEKAILRLKETHQQQAEEALLQRQRDGAEYKNKLSTLAKAMEALQSELRDEGAKNKVLMQELSVLKDLAEVGSTESQERLHYVERERQRDRTRLEGQLTDAKEQLRQQSEQRQQRDQLLATVEQQLQREREGRFSAMQKQRSLEDEAASLSSQIEALAEENGSIRKQLREHERKLSMALQAKEAELQRLTRRNEVLGEAVTRLTSGSHSEATVKVLTASAPICVSDYSEETRSGAADSPASRRAPASIGEGEEASNNAHSKTMVDEILSSLSAINKEISSITNHSQEAAELSSEDVLKMDFSDLSNDIFMRRPKSSYSTSNNNNSSSNSVLRSSADNKADATTEADASDSLPPKAESAPRAKSAPAARKSSTGKSSVNTSVNSSIDSIGSAGEDAGREALLMETAANSPGREVRTLSPRTQASISVHPASARPLQDHSPRPNALVDSSDHNRSGFSDEFTEDVTESSPFNRLSPDTVRTARSTTSSITANTLPYPANGKKSIRKQPNASAAQTAAVTDTDIFGMIRSPSELRGQLRPATHDSKYASRVRVTVEKGKEGLLEYSPKPKVRSSSAEGGSRPLNYDFLDGAGLGDREFDVMQTDIVTDSFSLRLGGGGGGFGEIDLLNPAAPKGKMLKPNKKLGQKALLRGGILKRK